MCSVYANENDKHAAHWLSCLPLQIHTIDDRSITEVSGHEVESFTQCHFFAGIGGWPLALDLAGWPNDAPVWTGSCPCQPFSTAGKRKGIKDERHLWPEFRRLIDECRPATIFGEQVASKDGRDWLATVRVDLEALGYAVGAADLSAASVGAPHIRQRLYWVAHRTGRGCKEHVQRNCDSSECEQQAPSRGDFGGCSENGGLANTRCDRSDTRSGANNGLEARERAQQIIDDQSSCGVGDTAGVRFKGGERPSFDICRPWEASDFVQCRDGKARPVKPGVRLLAHGVSGRVAQLRGLGNAIVPQVAAEFIKAFMETQQ